jgi:hypothetical protein
MVGIFTLSVNGSDVQATVTPPTQVYDAGRIIYIHCVTLDASMG